jgi:hypothetical protein
VADFYQDLDSRVRLHLITYETGTNTAGNYSTVHSELWLERTSGSGRFSYNTNYWSMVVDGQEVDGSGTYDLRGGNNQLFSNDFAVGHNADGTKTISVSGGLYAPDGNIGSGNVYGAIGLTTIARAPGAPTLTGITQTSLTSATLTWTAASAPSGAPVTGYQIQWATNPSFAGATTITVGNVTSYNVTGITTGAQVWMRAEAQNVATASGVAAPWSNTVTTMMLTGLKVEWEGAWVNAALYAEVNGVWVPCDVKTGQGGSWVPLAA